MILLGLCLAGPLILGFNKRIKFYSHPVILFYSICLPFVIYVLWDIIAAYRGHWSFNVKYISGIYIFNLPVEEILFFVIIPFCALFTWEVVKYYANGKGRGKA
jgi:lycopene cyclase domain-containing protein